MLLTLHPTIWLPKPYNMKRGAVVITEPAKGMRELSDLYMPLPLQGGFGLSPGMMMIGQACEKELWEGTRFQLAPHLVELGVSLQPLAWRPGLYFMAYNLAPWAVALNPGMELGSLTRVVDLPEELAKALEEGFAGGEESATE